MVLHLVDSKQTEADERKPVFTRQLLRDYEFIDLESEL